MQDLDPAYSSQRRQHTAFTELPLVDMRGLYSSDENARAKVAKSLDKATREAGFFYLSGHGIDPALIAELQACAKTYFSQSLDCKMRDYIGHSRNHSGYVPQGEEQMYSGVVDLKEAYDVGSESPSLMARFADQAENQWPELDGFKQSVGAYYAAMLNLSRTLFAGFALALGLPEHTFTDLLKNPPSQLRLIHYFDNPHATEHDSGIGAHTDYEFFTILLPTAPGLQVLNGAKQWIDVPLLPDVFVINIGDMLEAVTNGEYVATSHRVRQVKQERYAFPFFCALDYDTEVAPFSELLQGQACRPEYQEPVISGDHLLAQTMQTFGYLKARQERGEITLPEGSRSLASYGDAALKQG